MPFLSVGIDIVNGNLEDWGAASASGVGVAEPSAVMFDVICTVGDYLLREEVGGIIRT